MATMSSVLMRRIKIVSRCPIGACIHAAITAGLRITVSFAMNIQVVPNILIMAMGIMDIMATTIMVGKMP